MADKLNIYRAEINAGFGIIEMAVESTEQDALTDMTTVAEAAHCGRPGMFRVKNLRRSNRRITRRMDPVKSCTCADGYWAWIGERL
jgi:hypothetical protein